MMFVENESDLLAGAFKSSLLKVSKYKDLVDNAKRRGQERVYNAERTIKLEIAGNRAIAGLLDIFSEVVIELCETGFDVKKLKGRSQKLSQLMGRSLRPVTRKYDAMFCIIDFISGMTDRYAFELHRTLTGVSL